MEGVKEAFSFPSGKLGLAFLFPLLANLASALILSKYSCIEASDLAQEQRGSLFGHHLEGDPEPEEAEKQVAPVTWQGRPQATCQRRSGGPGVVPGGVVGCGTEQTVGYTIASPTDKLGLARIPLHAQIRPVVFAESNLGHVPTEAYGIYPYAFSGPNNSEWRWRTIHSPASPPALPHSAASMAASAPYRGAAGA